MQEHGYNNKKLFIATQLLSLSSDTKSQEKAAAFENCHRR